MPFLTAKLSTPPIKKAAKKAAGVLFWLILWQAAAMIIDKSIILVTPVKAFSRLAELIFEADFIRIVLNSFLRIMGGLTAGIALGILLAALAERLPMLDTLISPLMTVVKAVPVASFIILALFWINSSQLSAFICFLIVLPIIYNSVCEGISTADPKLIEAAKIYDFSLLKRIRFAYLPAIMPHLLGGVSTAAGLAFKSGAAAEVIGRPDLTLGDMLYKAKIYLETADLFAWTAVIIILSKLAEVLLLQLLRLAYRKTGRILKGGVCSDD